MRQETQRWDSVKLTAEIVVAGAGQSGLAPVVAVMDIATGNWLQAGGASFGTSFATNAMTETDVVNLPGSYEYDLPSALVDSGFSPGGGHMGYYVRVSEVTSSLLENIHVDILPSPNAAEVASGRTLSSVLEALFRTQIASDDGVFTGYVASASAAGDKFYSASSPGASTLYNYLGRLAVLHDTTLGSGEASELVRIGGSLTDGSGNYFLIQNTDGSAYTGLGASVGNTLYVLMQDAPSAGTSPTAVATAVWDTAMSAHTLAGTTGRALNVIQGMVQANHRMSNPTYDPEGRLLTADLVVYPTGADATAQTNAIATFSVTATYDVDGNMSTYLSAE